jgi:hypothetical protein
MYEFYLIGCNTQSIISSCSGALKFGVFLLRTQIYMQNIRRLSIKKTEKGDIGKL